MATSVKYVIDTCSIAELRRRYPRNLFPGVWVHLEGLIATGVLRSIEDVSLELNVQDDELSEWANSQVDFFIALDESQQQAAKALLVAHPTLVDIKRNKSSADPFLIAAAQLHGAAVVSEEKPSGGPPKVKIPDVCNALGVRQISLLQLIAETGYAG